MQKESKILLIIIFSCIHVHAIAQCTGGNFGGNLNITTTQQTIAVTGNTYYTFQADSGDRYFFFSVTIQNPGEITILDSIGGNIYTHDDTDPNGSFSIQWKAPYTGLFRALTNLRPCQTSQVNLGTMNYIYIPYNPFPTDSAQWSIRKTIGFPFSEHTTQYKMKGDTIINGINYSKVYSGIELNYFSQLDTLHCFVREEQRKVYVKYPASTGYDTTDILIYDFNLEIGDTFQVRLFNYNTDSIFDFTVFHISIYQANNDLRLYYYMTPTSNNINNVWGGVCEILFHWVSGVGAWLGPFYNEIPQLECDNFNNISYQIACFWEKGLYHLGGTFCDVNTAIVEIDQNLLSIYPNPSSGYFNIQLDNTTFKRIEIINSKGSLVESIEASNSNNIRIEYNLPTGLYLLRLIRNNGTALFKKIIIR